MAILKQFHGDGKAQKVEIKAYEETYRAYMVDVWEKSVRATHTFVSEEDIKIFKAIVKDIDFQLFSVYCIFIGDRLVGFIGVGDLSIEMLFLDPDYIGQGFGQKLMLLALNEHKANRVEVNEQNLNAVNFYKKFGFKVYERSETDSEGKVYPILKMKL